MDDKKRHLLNHRVGLGEQRGRHGEAERILGLAIYDQLELGGLLHWEASGLCALQDFVDEAGCTTKLRCWRQTAWAESNTEGSAKSAPPLLIQWAGISKWHLIPLETKTSSTVPPSS